MVVGAIVSVALSFIVIKVRLGCPSCILASFLKRTRALAYVPQQVLNTLVAAQQLELTTGIMPSLSMATSLIAFGVLKAYTAVLTRLGWHHAQFTPQV